MHGKTMKYGIISFLQYTFYVLLSDDDRREPKHIVGIQENAEICTTFWFTLQCKVFGALIVKGL